MKHLIHVLFGVCVLFCLSGFTSFAANVSIAGFSIDGEPYHRVTATDTPDYSLYYFDDTFGNRSFLYNLVDYSTEDYSYFGNYYSGSSVNSFNFSGLGYGYYFYENQVIFSILVDYSNFNIGDRVSFEYRLGFKSLPDFKIDPMPNFSCQVYGSGVYTYFLCQQEVIIGDPYGNYPVLSVPLTFYLSDLTTSSGYSTPIGYYSLYNCLVYEPVLITPANYSSDVLEALNNLAVPDFEVSAEGVTAQTAVNTTTSNIESYEDSVFQANSAAITASGLTSFSFGSFANGFALIATVTNGLYDRLPNSFKLLIQALLLIGASALVLNVAGRVLSSSRRRGG